MRFSRLRALRMQGVVYSLNALNGVYASSNATDTTF